MFSKVAAVATVSAAFFPLAVAAQSQSQSSSASNQQPSTQNQENVQSLPRQVQQKLTSQGFTDVKVVPGSLLVSAKDKDGDPVTMVIGPQSMTIFTMHSSDRSTTGSGEAGRNQSTTGPSSR